MDKYLLLTYIAGTKLQHLKLGDLGAKTLANLSRERGDEKKFLPKYRVRNVSK